MKKNEIRPSEEEVLLHEPPPPTDEFRFFHGLLAVQRADLLDVVSSSQVSASSDGLVQVCDWRQGANWKAAQTIADAAAGGVCFGALWRLDKEVVTCGDDYCVKKWDLRSLKNGPIENYLGHTSVVR